MLLRIMTLYLELGEYTQGWCEVSLMAEEEEEEEVVNGVLTDCRNHT